MIFRVRQCKSPHFSARNIFVFFWYYKVLLKLLCCSKGIPFVYLDIFYWRLNLSDVISEHIQRWKKSDCEWGKNHEILWNGSMDDLRVVFSLESWVIFYDWLGFVWNISWMTCELQLAWSCVWYFMEDSWAAIGLDFCVRVYRWLRFECDILWMTWELQLAWISVWYFMDDLHFCVIFMDDWDTWVISSGILGFVCNIVWITCELQLTWIYVGYFSRNLGSNRRGILYCFGYFYIVYFEFFKTVCLKDISYPIYQPLRSGRIWHKVNF